MHPAIRFLAAAICGLAAISAHSQIPCSEKPDEKTHGECMAAVMAPLEARINQLVSDLGTRFKNEAATELSESARAWNGYRHHQCWVEAVATLPPDTAPNLLSQKVLASCVYRLTTLRVSELEKLK